MTARVKAFLDLRQGETLPVLLSFFYIATVVASFLLAKPIRNGLFLKQFGAYALVYVYVGVPLALSVFVPVYSAIVARWGQQTVIRWTLAFFAMNVLAFWYFFTFHRFAALPAVFYIWVNCFGIIAPVQAWTFANALFDTRQAKRLFGLVGSGASVGAITGGMLARFLVQPVGGAVNLLLVLAGLIVLATVIVTIAGRLASPKAVVRSDGRARAPFLKSLQLVAGSRYLGLIAVLVFLVAIATQWTQFQFSLAAEQRFARDADRLTQFFGAFNLYLGILALLIQLLLTGTVLRRFGIAFTILLLPMSLWAGSALILLAPRLWAVLVTNACDQGLRFSIDKATYELLYLPIPPSIRSEVKTTIDVFLNRVADGVAGVLLGLATRGFLALPGAGFGLRGTAALNLVLIGLWIAVAMALRKGYVEAMRESIRQHRLDAERVSAPVLDRSTTEILATKLSADDPDEILYALSLFEMQHRQVTHPAVLALLDHPGVEVRRRALALLRAADDRSALSRVERLLTDPDLQVRTEALLFLTHHGQIDPVTRITELGDFPDFSIRAGMVSFLAQPGRTQNLDAARMILAGMVDETGPAGQRTRLEAAELMAVLPNAFPDQLRKLLRDPDPDVARQAIRAVGRLGPREFVRDVVERLGDPRLMSEAADALVKLGERVVGTLRDHLFDQSVAVTIRREIPGILLRIGSDSAQRVLIESLLETDTSLRFRIIASLNKLKQLNPDLAIDSQVVEIVLAAEIMGHYRSYQVLGTLGGVLHSEDPVVSALKQSMEQEIERIFRLMGLLFPGQDLHTAYVGLQSDNPLVRANALEFLDNVLKPELRNLLVPLLDSQVTIEERVRRANRLVGTAVETHEEAVAVLLAGEDPWLQSCGAYAVGALKLKGLEDKLDRWLDDPDPLLRETARAAKTRLAEEPTEEPAEPEPLEVEPAWDPSQRLGVG